MSALQRYHIVNILRAQTSEKRKKLASHVKWLNAKSNFILVASTSRHTCAFFLFDARLIFFFILVSSTSRHTRVCVRLCVCVLHSNTPRSRSRPRCARPAAVALSFHYFLSHFCSHSWIYAGAPAGRIPPTSGLCPRDPPRSRPAEALSRSSK